MRNCVIVTAIDTFYRHIVYNAEAVVLVTINEFQAVHLQNIEDMRREEDITQLLPYHYEEKR